jgi:hypothetical protein
MHFEQYVVVGLRRLFVIFTESEVSATCVETPVIFHCLEFVYIFKIFLGYGSILEKQMIRTGATSSVIFNSSVRSR